MPSVSEPAFVGIPGALDQDGGESYQASKSGRTSSFRRSGERLDACRLYPLLRDHRLPCSRSWRDGGKAQAKT